MRYYLLCLTSLWLLACRQETAKPPLTEAQTAQMMSELYIAEAGANAANFTSKDSLIAKYYEQAFEINKISRADYETSINRYAQDLEAMTRIIRSANDILTEKSKPKINPQ